MSKLQNAYEKSVDYLLGLTFQFWDWLGQKLGVNLTVGEIHALCDLIEQGPQEVVVFKDRPDTVEALGRLLWENEKLEGTVADLKARLDEHAKGAHRPNRKKLTKREVETIHQLHRSGAKNVDIAYSFDVNPATISRIVRGLYYGKVAA